MSFREELSGLVALPCLMDSSAVMLARRIGVVLREEQAKPLPDNHLIAVLCDAARLIDELLDVVRYRQDSGVAFDDSAKETILRVATELLAEGDLRHGAQLRGAVESPRHGPT